MCLPAEFLLASCCERGKDTAGLQAQLCVGRVLLFGDSTAEHSATSNHLMTKK